MQKISIRDIAKAVKGELINDKAYDILIDDISTDSRNVHQGTLFVPIVGEKNDGHNFILKAMEAGASCSFTQIDDSNVIGANPIIKVKNTVEALGDLARYYKNLFEIKTIAVTGSVGKTTTKDMIAAVLNVKHKVLKTEGNYNNEIGLPLTIFRIEKENKVAVLEMGMSAFGEIDYLSSIARPSMAVITNIGTSHIENLGSREGILKAKSEIFANLCDGGLAILNADDDMLETLENKLGVEIVWFGIDDKKGVYADNICSKGLDGIDCDIHINGDILSVHIPSPGKHMIYNAMAAVIVADRMGLTYEQIQEGIRSFIPTKMRMNITTTELGITLINDAYNASLQSMKAALDVLKLSGGKRKVAILSDMLELGEFAPALHKEVGEYCTKVGVDIVIAVGELGKYIFEGAKEAKKLYYFKSQEQLIEKIDSILHKDDVVLVKASRGMHLEKTVEKITQLTKISE